MSQRLRDNTWLAFCTKGKAIGREELGKSPWRIRWAKGVDEYKKH